MNLSRKAVSVIVLISLLLVALSVMGGIELEKYNNRQRLNNQKEIQTVAVVILDTGFTNSQGEVVYYSNQLIDTSDKTYVVTGLEDARTGINLGKYGGYIIIPDNFSRNVESVHSTGNKTVFQYEISNNLTETAKMNTLENIINFEKRFNNVLSYMYIDAIFEEFHTGQNFASSVINSDRNDLDVLLSIKGIDLIAAIELTELKVIENNLQDLDLVNEYAFNEEIIKNIDTSYKGYLEVMNEQFNEIRDDTTTFNNSFKDVLTVIEETDILLLKENNPIYQNAISNLNAYIDQYNLEIETFRSELENRLHALEILIENQSISVFDKLTNIEAQLLTNISNYIITFPVCPDTNDTGSAMICTMEVPPPSDSGSEENLVLYSNQDPEISLDEQILLAGIDFTFDNLIEQDVKDLISELTNSITSVKLVDNSIIIDEVITNIIDKIKTKEQETIQDLREVYNDKTSAVDELYKKMIDFDPLSTIDEAEIQGYVYDFQSNIRDIETKIANQNNDYLDYVDIVYETSTQNVDSLKSDIIATKQRSDEQLISGLERAHNSRIDSSARNQNLMTTFINKLPNTRMGSIGNTQIYDFITNPVNALATDTTSNNNNVFQEPGILLSVILLTTIVSSVFGLLFILLLSIFKQSRKLSISHI